ncbi:LAFA_0B07426g1_1 [Lachancea sp. 'fantastica']|nr:LAFA_0B07426g1_1 [Lachancea sp. 'fantastica']
MINESVKEKEPVKTLKNIKAETAMPAVTARPASPPSFDGLVKNRVLDSFKQENDLHSCSSVESLESLRHTPEPLSLSSFSTASGSKKYISNDFSPYGSRSQSQSPVNGLKIRPTCTTSYLKPRKEYTGFQISGYKKNHVHVVLQTVDLPVQGCETACVPHLTGFFTIRGLTEHQPEITTFFEGFAATSNSGFLSSDMPSQLKDLTAADSTDLEHWLNFPSFQEMCRDEKVASSIADGSYVHSEYLEKRFIYMRWKERFLVPDAELDSVEGASYEGYYYIVHDQLTGDVLGFYYHADAERFQRLELAPVNDRTSGSCGFEFN